MGDDDVDTQKATRCFKMSSAILNDQQRGFKITDSLGNIIKISYDCVVSSMPADDLALLGARTSAGIGMTKYGGPHI